MGIVVKRLLVRVVIVAVVGGVLTVVPQLKSAEKSYEISDADITVTVLDDASLQVDERLTFDFSGDFEGAYRDIPLVDGARITDLTVSEDGQEYRPGGNTGLGSSGLPGSFGTVGLSANGNATGDTSQGVRTVWHYRASDEKRTFDVSYHVKGAVIAGEDSLDVGWTVWGDQWDFWLDDLHAEIVPPAGAQAGPSWVQPRKLGAEPSSGLAAAVDIERVPEGDALVLRTLIPRSAVSSVDGARSGPADAGAQAEAEEAELAESFGAKAANFVTDNVLLLCLLWTGLVVAIAIALYVRGRDLPTDIPEHLPDPPEQVSPALAYALATEGDYSDRVVTATLLDLVDRGYYAGRASAGSEDLDLELSVPAERPATTGLAPYELKALEFFDELLGSKTVGLSKLKDEVPAHSEEWRGRWQSLNDALDQAEEGELGWDLDLTGARAALGLIAFAGYAALLVLYFIRTQWVAIPGTALLAGMLLIYLLPATWLKRLDPAGRERNARWAAFSRWTKDFPRLEDDPPATLKLWRSILVYAVAFGSAEQVAKSGRIPAPVGAEATGSGDWTAVMLTSSAYSYSFGGFSSGFSSQVAPESSSGGGGGGGGGGFSGGGGGGAW